MTWLPLILIAVNLSSINSLIDKFFCEKKFRNVLSYQTLNNLLTIILVIGLSFFIRFDHLYGWPLILAILSGFCYLLSWLFYFRAIVSLEASRAAAVFNLFVIFTVILAALFLQETINPLKWLAIFLIVIGAFLCSYEKGKRVKDLGSYWWVILSTIMSAIGNIFSKLAVKQIEALTVLALTFYVTFPVFLFLFFRNKEINQEVKNVFNSSKRTGLIILRQIIGFSSMILFYLAIARGPISLIIAINGSGPMLVFIFSTFVSFFFPGFIKEEIKKEVIILKLISIMMIITGVVIISL